jgi:hypothetical protein
MSHSLLPGPVATPADLRAAQDRQLLVRSELPRVRSAAVAWRNGLGGLLAGVAGFSLIRGRSDIGQLAEPWAAAVGVLLLAAIIAGSWGAVLLIRAANGRPSVAAIRDVPTRGAADHIEALASARALRSGIVLTIACAALLVAAVGGTWYGPARHEPTLLIITPAGTVCGTVIRIDHAQVLLGTEAGQVMVDTAAATAIQPLESCP